MMSAGEGPRESEELRVKSEEFATAIPTVQSNSQLKEKPADVLPEEWLEHSAIMRAIREWKLEHVEDAPLLDPDELRDPRIREWREKIRQGCNFNKTRKRNGEQQRKR